MVSSQPSFWLLDKTTMDTSDQIATETVFLQLTKVYVPRLIVYLKEEFGVDSKKNEYHADIAELVSPFSYKFVNSIYTHTFLPRYLERIYWTSKECQCVNDFYKEVLPLFEEEGHTYKLQVFPNSRTLKIGDGIMCHLEAKALGQPITYNTATTSNPASNNNSSKPKSNSRKKATSTWMGSPPSRPDVSLLPPDMPAKLLAKLSPTNYTHILYVIFPGDHTDQRLLYGVKSSEHSFHRNEVEYCAPTSKSKKEKKKPKQNKQPSKEQPVDNMTDADIRKLPMRSAAQILLGFGVPEAEIANMTRWERVKMVRDKYQEEAARKKSQEQHSNNNNNNSISSQPVEEEEQEEEEEEEEEQVISRAYFKLRESMERFHIKLPSNPRAVDVGAAPGGMTQFFSALIEKNNPGMNVEILEHSDNPYQVSKAQLDKGIVFAIDPAALRIDPKNVLHLQLKAEQALDHIKKYAPFDIIVCDINALPFHAINIFQPFVPYLKEGGYLVWTVKRYWTCYHMETIEKEFLERFPNTFKNIQVKWMFANKNERMLCAQK